MTAAPFFVPGRAEKPQEPLPPPRTQSPQAEPARPYVSQTVVCDSRARAEAVVDREVTRTRGSIAAARRRVCQVQRLGEVVSRCSRLRWLDPILGGEAIDQPSQVRISGELGDESLPRAPAESRPSHKRPGCRFPLLCSLAARQEGRVAVIVDDKGMTAIGVDRSVWLYASSQDVPGELIGALQRA